MSESVLIYIGETWYCHEKFWRQMIYDHITKNDNVNILKCINIFTNTCKQIDNIAPIGVKTGCEYCHKRFQTIVNKIGIPSENIISLDNKNVHNKKYSFDTYNDLLDFKYKDVAIGSTIVNIIAVALGNDEFNTVENKNIINQIINEHIAFIDYLISIINNYNIVYTFGIRNISREIGDLCKKNNIKSIGWEYGRGTYDFLKYPSPLDLNYMYREQIKHWENASEEKYEITKKYFNDKYLSKNTGSFTYNQNNNSLPEYWDTNKRNIVVYDTTLLELVGDPLFENQTLPFRSFLAYIYLLTQTLINNQNIIFHYKSHPFRPRCYSGVHRNFYHNSYISNLRVLYSMNLPNLHVYLPHTEFNSYKLLENSSICLTYCSTMGIEATYYNKPSIALGPANYEDNYSVYSPKTHKEVMELIQNNQLIPKNKENALIHGFFLANYGEKFTVPDNWKWENIYTHDNSDVIKRRPSIIKDYKKKFIQKLKKIFIKKLPASIDNIYDFSEADEYFKQPPSQKEIADFFCQYYKLVEQLNLSDRIRI